MSKAYAVVRVRGRTNVKPGIADNMKYLGLTRKNHCTIVSDSKESQGMIFKSKDYITWGQVDEKNIARMLKERGMVSSSKKLTDEYVKENSKYADIKTLASKIAKGDARLSDVKGMKHYFRLNPPKKGFERKGIKKPYTVGGALGNRGEKINELLERMI
jgi:large subunit ribosomal protein L30